MIYTFMFDFVRLGLIGMISDYLLASLNIVYIFNKNQI